MARETFDRHLQMLLDQVLVLGSKVEQAVLDALQALKRRDHVAARRIYEADIRINEKRAGSHPADHVHPLALAVLSEMRKRKQSCLRA